MNTQKPQLQQHLDKALLAVTTLLISGMVSAEVVKFENASVARCISVNPEHRSRNGAKAKVYTCRASADQEWQVIDGRDGWKKLKSKSNGRCLNIHRGREDREGGLVSIYRCADSRDQEWKILRDEHGVQLRNRSTGRCLNVHRGRHNYDGAPATSYSCSQTPDQKWAMTSTPVDDEISSTISAIQGGIRDSNSLRRNATVRLESAGGTLVCSGVLISPTLVLSAGHCWHPSTGRPRPAGITPFAQGDWETPGDWYPLPATIFARVGSNDAQAGATFGLTQYTLAGNTDIIMFRLANPVPATLAVPATVITTDGPAVEESAIRTYLSGKTLRVAGWGAVSSTVPQPRFRRTVGDVVFRAWSDTDAGINPSKMIVRSVSSATLMPGDSGGPLYWQDGSVLKLIGITQAEGRHVMTFFRGGTKKSGGAPLPDLAMWINEHLDRQDCLAFNEDDLELIQLRGRWKIAEGNHVLFDFRGAWSNANRALGAIRRYNLNRSCFLNRPGSSFNYLLNDSSIPSGSLPSEDCIRIDTNDLVYEERTDYWQIKNSRGASYFSFDKKHLPDGEGGTGKSRHAAFNSAHAAMTLLQEHDPRYVCYVGRPNPGMMYLRR